jgi:hypothetical protein
MRLTDSWELLTDKENDRVWAFVYQRFSFQPTIQVEKNAFDLTLPHDRYSCERANHKAETDPQWTETIRKIVATVMTEKEQNFCYALDWQHSGFNYKPEQDQGKHWMVEVKKEGNWLYNVYFPTFYPDGDYYLFMATDFSWGWLTDPWRKQIIVYGERLRTLVQNEKEYLALDLLFSSKK